MHDDAALWCPEAAGRVVRDMDRTRGQPAGSQTESWGACSGAGMSASPPRLARRNGFVPEPAPDVIIDPMPGGPAQAPAPPAAPPEALATVAAQPSSLQLAAANASPKHARLRSRSVVVPSSLGAVAMLAVVVATVLSRPEVEAGSPPLVAAVVAAPEILPEEPPAQPSMPTVHLRIGAGLAPETGERVKAALTKAGYAAVVVHQMPFSISRSRVGYFRETDRESAEALAAQLRGTLDGIELRDYRALMEKPEAGRLDLWIGS